MHNSARAAFVPFTAQFEGVVPWMYADVKGLVSTGIGNLIDPIQLALVLPFVRPGGAPASRDEIATEWLRVKNDPSAASRGHLYAETITKLRLTDDGVSSLVARKLDQNDALLLRRFPDFESWPADAQLATHSMAWACGPAFRFPKLATALQRRDFLTASVECFMPEEATISGLRPRNKANRVLYQNADRVERMGLVPEMLYYPEDLTIAHPSEPIVHPDVPLGDGNPPDDVS